jgi:hypothetical protein
VIPAVKSFHSGLNPFAAWMIHKTGTLEGEKSPSNPDEHLTKTQEDPELNSKNVVHETNV